MQRYQVMFTPFPQLVRCTIARSQPAIFYVWVKVPFSKRLTERLILSRLGKSLPYSPQKMRILVRDVIAERTHPGAITTRALHYGLRRRLRFFPGGLPRWFSSMMSSGKRGVDIRCGASRPTDRRSVKATNFLSFFSSREMRDKKSCLLASLLKTSTLVLSAEHIVGFWYLTSDRYHEGNQVPGNLFLFFSVIALACAWFVVSSLVSVARRKLGLFISYTIVRYVERSATSPSPFRFLIFVHSFAYLSYVSCCKFICFNVYVRSSTTKAMFHHVVGPSRIELDDGLSLDSGLGMASQPSSPMTPKHLASFEYMTRSLSP